MKSHEIIKESCKKRGIKKIAADVGVSTSLLYKWSQPPEASGSGSKNPLDRMINLMQAANDPQMINWICEQAGGYFVRNPNDQEENNYDVMPATNEIVSQFSALLSEISEAAQDNAIANNESERIRKVWNALKSFTEGFVKCCEEGDFNKMLESK
ncbi:MAG: phage regulatory CII family protein [Verrucomicrobiota bacterium]|nr:phage regulatory CII family protein [Verrucomicrobiota bacterium]